MSPLIMAIAVAAPMGTILLLRNASRLTGDDRAVLLDTKKWTSC